MLKFRIKDMIKDQGLAYREVARRMNLDYASFFRILRIGSDPKLSFLYDLTQALDVPFGEISKYLEGKPTPAARRLYDVKTNKTNKTKSKKT